MLMISSNVSVAETRNQDFTEKITIEKNIIRITTDALL